MNKHRSLFLLVSLLFLSFSPLGANQRMLLRFQSKAVMTSSGPYGRLVQTQASEGYVYLNPGPDGKLSCTGSIDITITFDPASRGSITYTPLKGQSSIQAEAVTEGRFIVLNFSSQKIPCKGDVLINHPSMGGQRKESMELFFDPGILASRVSIELKDGARKSTSFTLPGYTGGNQEITHKVDFVLNHIESWRVTAEGEELDPTQPPIKNSRLKTPVKELPVAMLYKWNLVAEFSLIGEGASKQYFDGQIFSAKIIPVNRFQHEDLYRMGRIQGSSDWDSDTLIGQTLSGKASAQNVRLEWPTFTAPEPYMFIPAQSYLGKKAHRRTFESMEWMGYLTKENLRLIDGTVVTGGADDWLNFTIHLKKIK